MSRAARRSAASRLPRNQLQPGQALTAMLRMMKTIACVARKRGRMWTACASGRTRTGACATDCHIGKNYVGERVLSEKRSLLDVDQDAAEERDQHAHPVRLAQCPEEECDRDKIRHPGRAVQHEVEQDAHQNGGADPERIRRLQDVLPGCVAMVDGEGDGKSVFQRLTVRPPSARCFAERRVSACHPRKDPSRDRPSRTVRQKVRRSA